MFEGIFVPEAILVEDEVFARASVLEAEGGVEGVDLPHERSLDFSGVDLLKTVDIYIESLGGSE